MSDGSSAFLAVAAALAEDGFSPRVTVGGADFRGTVNVGELKVALRIEFSDLEFAEPGRVFVDDPSAIPRPVLPHLDELNELCVVDRRAFVADRYQAAAQARGIVVKAQSVIERGLTRHATDEIAREFPQHWGGPSIGVEFGAYEGPLGLGSDAGGNKKLVPHRGKVPVDGYALTTPLTLSFTDTQKRPNTFGEFLAWTKAWDPSLSARVLDALAGLSSNLPYCMIVAANGVVGIQLLLSSRGTTLAAALGGRPQGRRRALNTPIARKLAVQRWHGHRVDLAYVLSRNGGEMAPLAGKRVVLVGCGSIGGFLARSLAQLGAGSSGGSLTLIDDEILAATNIGRHVLGSGDIGQGKVDACRAMIQRDLPGTDVLARPFQVQSQRVFVARSDLLIDATGEQGVSEMLNAWMLEASASSTPFPGLLHTWIEGAGAAVRSFVTSDPEFGCFRCLRPDHLEKDRYPVLKEGTIVELGGGCGELAFTPYGPAAPLMAAALAAKHAVDWAAGHPRKLLRTGRVDWETTNEVKPVNPPASNKCPACDRA